MNTTKNQIQELLSNREIQLIRLLTQGYKRSEIADQMAMSLHTYDGYRKNIRSKLQIKNQADWARIIYSFS